MLVLVNYYDPFAAHKIFDDYPELEIEPIFLSCILSIVKNVLHLQIQMYVHMMQMIREQISGTKLREMIQNGRITSQNLS